MALTDNALSRAIAGTAIADGSKAGARWAKITLPVFAATIFLSAFLLFSLQPFFAKMALPKLGGSPGVWSVAMVFFQAVLLLGYAWAHWLTTRLTLKTAAMLHLGVMLLAFVFLPVAIPRGWDAPPETGQAIWLLALFGAAAGLPFFAVSANGPLLQAWFARTGHKHAADPYFLYGASNIGSFASLILYIAAFEPLMTVSGQSIAWAAGFGALGAAIAGCAILAAGQGGRAFMAEISAGAPAKPVPKSATGWRERFTWMGLAAIPSGLLVAVTAHISVDIAAAPFLWVVPLALFLLTFVLAFARRPVFSVEFLSDIVPVLAAMVFVTLVLGHFIPIGLSLAAHLVFFFFAALLAHSVLVARRPAAGELTSFYFWMSLGGVIGGAFTTLLSPWIFSWVAEYPLLILAALFLRPSLYAAPRREIRIFILTGALVAVLLNNPLVGRLLMPGEIVFYAIAVSAFAVAAVVARKRSEALHIFFAILIAGFNFAMQGAYGNLFAERSFFGVVRAFKSDEGKFVVMAHGTTEHGAMRLGDHASPPVPLAYYHESGGIAAALFSVQEKLAGAQAQIGAVGLGAGAMYCHRNPGETWTFFEIDRSVVRAASDSAIFRFVSECGQGDPVVVGDARLTLAGQPAGKFDYLLIDAFSSDSIPVHLLTVEALNLYKSRLAQGGILTIHISNRYMELGSVLAALARETGMTGRIGEFLPPGHLKKGQHVNPSQVVALARTEEDLGAIGADSRWKPLNARDTAVWTDDYSNILAAIWRKLGR